MVIVEGNNIRISKGDTLEVTFIIEGYSISESDEIKFSVKKEYFGDKLLLEKTLTNITGNEIKITLSSEDMLKLPIGTNYYDLVCLSADKKVTFNFPAKIIIERIVHNVGYSN